MQTTQLTTITDDEDRRITLSQLDQFANVEIEGIERRTEDRTFIEALKIEVEMDDAEENFRLQGLLSALNNDSITVLGVIIEFDESTEFDEETLDALQAFVDLGQRVTLEIDYRKENNRFIAEEIEIEED